jgi:hypothetical protein
MLNCVEFPDIVGDLTSWYMAQVVPGPLGRQPMQSLDRAALGDERFRVSRRRRETRTVGRCEGTGAIVENLAEFQPVA